MAAATVTATVGSDTDADTSADANANAKRVLSTTEGWGGNEDAARRFRTWLENETKVLDLSGCNLVQLPVSLGNLTSLTIFSCSYNQLTSIPDSIGNLVSLCRLWVNNNQLTSLPYSLGHLPLLTELNCYNNKIPEDEPSTLEELQAIALARRRSVKGRTGC